MKKQINTTIKAHLIRGALYLMFIVTVCAIPFALAQRNTTSRTTTINPATNQNMTLSRGPASSTADTNAAPATSGASKGVPLQIPPHPKAPQIILYDQYNNASAIGTLSTMFSDIPMFSSDLADDFIVPTGQTWSVQSIDADGAILGPGPVASFNVFFYADNAGLPGAHIYTAMNQPFTVTGSTFTVNLPTMAVLNAGTYWVEIQANMMFASNGAWVWTDRTVQSNNGAAWQNPGGGFGVCPTWALKTTCVQITGGPDQVFRLNGTTGQGTPTPTATASPSASATATATATTTASPSGTPSTSPSATATPTPTATASPTASQSVTPTPTPTPTQVGCVHGFGFWKNHPDQWPVTTLQLGTVTYTQQQLLDILHQPVRGNGLVSLAHHLIAALLNIANGANPNCIQQTIDQANALIGNLVIPPIGNGYLAPRDVGGLVGHLDSFNEGGMCAPRCEGSPEPSPTEHPHPPQRQPPPPRPH